MKTSQHWCRFVSKYCNLIFAVIVFVAIDPISLFCSCLLSDHGILCLDTSLHTLSYLKTICWHITLLNTFQHITRLFSSSYIISSFSLAALTSYNFCHWNFFRIETKPTFYLLYYFLRKISYAEECCSHDTGGKTLHSTKLNIQT